MRSLALHPGSIASGLQKFMTPEMMLEVVEMWERMGKEMPTRKTLQQGCSTTLRAALDPSLAEEEDARKVYLSDCQLTVDPDTVRPFAVDGENARRCWRLSEEMVREKFEY